MHIQPQNQAKMTETTHTSQKRRTQSFGDMGLSWKKEMIAEHDHECIKCH